MLPSPVRPWPIFPAATEIFRYQTRCQRRPASGNAASTTPKLIRPTIVRDRYRGSGARLRRSGGIAPANPMASAASPIRRRLGGVTSSLDQRSIP